MTKTVYICSPLKAYENNSMEQNIEKAKSYCRYAISKNVMPICPHVYFTQFMDDNVESERAVCLEYGKQLLFLCSELWVFGEFISSGMQGEIEFAKEKNITVKYIKGVE